MQLRVWPCCALLLPPRSTHNSCFWPLLRFTVLMLQQHLCRAPRCLTLCWGQSGKAAPSSFCTDLTTTGTAVGTTEQCWCLLEVTAASGRDESHRAATTATEAWLELFKNPNAVTTNTIQCFNYFPLWSQLGPISNDLQLHSSKQSSDYFRLF